MTGVPAWHLRGDWFDVCKCDIPCPCEFAQAPTGNECQGILVWHVREGRYGDVSLDGLNVVGVAEFEGNIWAGEAAPVMGLIIDEKADGQQREALQTIFGGQAGGFPAEFAKLIAEVRGVEFAPITFDISEGPASWRAEVPGKLEASAHALTGPMTPPGALVQTTNPPGSEVGPGGTATWGVADRDRANVLGFDFQWDGKSSKHIPFEWSGPS
ncbi:MAG: DUF1326 domain-containing protein [Candidatus Dormibacteraeota bacterium]|nr:DUF1326 domain-containing protein [Candidatus Dormibacteraeota bacterium]MBO0762726.1 DUF1326 domain-containing protein [Candidatus Dormibacteraeota bacterium]